MRSVPGGDVIFDWHTTRAATCLQKLVPLDFNGTLQCDGYTAYDRFASLRAQEGKPLTLAGCFAHVRRGFFEALKLWSKLLTGGLGSAGLAAVAKRRPDPAPERLGQGDQLCAWAMGVLGSISQGRIGPELLASSFSDSHAFDRRGLLYSSLSAGAGRR